MCLIRICLFIIYTLTITFPWDTPSIISANALGMDSNPSVTVSWGWKWKGSLTNNFWKCSSKLWGPQLKFCVKGVLVLGVKLLFRKTVFTVKITQRLSRGVLKKFYKSNSWWNVVWRISWAEAGILKHILHMIDDVEEYLDQHVRVTLALTIQSSASVTDCWNSLHSSVPWTLPHQSPPCWSVSTHLSRIGSGTISVSDGQANCFSTPGFLMGLDL